MVPVVIMALGQRQAVMHLLEMVRGCRRWGAICGWRALVEQKVSGKMTGSVLTAALNKVDRGADDFFGAFGG